MRVNIKCPKCACVNAVDLDMLEECIKEDNDSSVVCARCRHLRLATEWRKQYYNWKGAIKEDVKPVPAVNRSLVWERLRRAFGIK